MVEKSVGKEEREQSEHLRTLAKDKNWPAFIAAVSPEHHESVKFVALNQLRLALMQSRDGEAEDIIAALTPEALLALAMPLEKIRGFAEALMRGSDIERLNILLTSAAEVEPADPVIAGLQVWVFGRLGKISAIRKAMRDRRAAFANPHVLILASDYTALKSEEHDRVVAYFEDLPGDSEVQARLQAIRWLYRAGETERAEHIARRYQGNAGAPEYDGIVNILNNAPACEPRLKPFEATPAILVGHSPGDRGALIYFNGFGKKGPTKADGKVLERYIADLGLTMISVKDPTHLLCLAGIPDVADTIEESAAILKAIVSGLGIDKIYTMGGSSGGFPAVVYGLELKADGAILFGSPTDCGPANSHVDTRAQVVARKLKNKFDSRTLDMVAWLDEAEHQLPITIYYGAENQVDTWHAKRIKDRPNVRAIALDQVASHHVMVETVRGRKLGEVISEGLSLPPTHR